MTETSTPTTWRTGPSDPLAYADGPGTWAETRVAAPPAVVWALVSEPGTLPQFSDECIGAAWNEDQTPGLGAVFTGTNENDNMGQWSIPCVIDRFEPEREFGWSAVSLEDPGARWWFTLTPDGDGTVLRYEVTLGPGPSGMTWAIENMPDREAAIIVRRIQSLHANMVRTVEGIRDLAEAAS